jgi:hypothetical protein
MPELLWRRQTWWAFKNLDKEEGRGTHGFYIEDKVEH